MKIAFILNVMLRIFHRCQYHFVSGSMVLNGKQDVDFALRFRPEYDAIERCSCGKERKVNFLSYSDKSSAHPIVGLEVHKY
jgi:hypothetical protein